ncbi:hypothetical protein J6590_036111 [Homalodisca vitripennis]|nr:hypothetical protein J6590_036111 [Homalodisca vitripennis]
MRHRRRTSLQDYNRPKMTQKKFMRYARELSDCQIFADDEIISVQISLKGRWPGGIKLGSKPVPCSSRSCITADTHVTAPRRLYTHITRLGGGGQTGLYTCRLTILYTTAAWKQLLT